MSFSSVPSVRLGNLGFLSVGVIAFALVTLQGCAGSTVTASSVREPGSPVAGLGPLRADDAPRTTTREQAERPAPVRVQEPRERTFRSYNSCRRCAP